MTNRHNFLTLLCWLKLTHLPDQQIHVQSLQHMQHNNLVFSLLILRIHMVAANLINYMFNQSWHYLSNGNNFFQI